MSLQYWSNSNQLTLFTGYHMSFLWFGSAFSEHEAKVNVTNKAGVTPLHDAVTRGDLDIAKILLQYGAKYDIKATEGYVA